MFIATIQKATAAGILSYTVPQDSFLLAAIMTSGGFISTDPALTGAEVTAPLADGQKSNVFLAVASSVMFTFPTRIQLGFGEVLYLGFTGKGTAVLYFDSAE